LHNGKIGALLPGLPEDVALSAAGDKTGLERVPWGDSATQVSRLEYRHCKARRLERRSVDIVAGRPGDRALRCASGSQRHNGVRNSVVDAVKNASNGSRIVEDAEGLPTLQDHKAL